MKNVSSRYLYLSLFTFLLISCKSVGPKYIPADQFNFNTSISQASNEQLLMNLVRLRYSEPPVFLKVSSVINQYTRAGGMGVQGGLNNAIPTGANSAVVNGNLAWSNTPTITYIPVSGREFSANLLVPIPPASLLNMIQSGWPIDLVLHIATFAINGLRDDIARPSARRDADPEFIQLLDLWKILSTAGIIGTAKDERTKLIFRNDYPPEYKDDVARFKTILKLDPKLSEYFISYGSIQGSSDEITALTGSIWEIMLNLAWQFEVPPEHVASGRTDMTYHSTNMEARPPLQILYSKEKPEREFISVYQHEYWFYIDPDDRNTKRNFSFLQLLLNLAESTTDSKAPIVTVPTN
ncbi:hypothetical protein ACFLR9_05190 [Bacteroidota bacterium]|jgi:hypothetical protein